MKKIENVKNDTIATRERDYASKLQVEKHVVAAEEDVTLF